MIGGVLDSGHPQTLDTKNLIWYNIDRKEKEREVWSLSSSFKDKRSIVVETIIFLIPVKGREDEVPKKLSEMGTKCDQEGFKITSVVAITLNGTTTNLVYTLQKELDQ